MVRAWLANIRKEKNLTMCQVATEAGISECYYSQIESGKRNVPVNTAKSIATVLKFDWKKFYE